ncbi:MAG: DEAD/DEAH box helicase family protein [Thermoflexaceae bacterium]|nr:DEAD/DEAH box helicase family protein [Thermoflexaceae bacterium]
MDGAAALTAAKVDLLPHQIVLTHRVATASPRRFLIADDVGLGKTIETALVLRELASRGEMERALMVVPAGLVENWRRELNDVFRLDFEVFGSEGDVTDRKTNAFERHHRLIASIDTLKRPARMERLAEAPPWDLVVFDEAHHLTATRTGNRVRKTDNYRLAEQLREHCRDLLLLTATPHQGDHFRFLTLTRLLNPTLFHDERDMLENRHRLNTIVVRRTKADACRPDGSALFARRQVHTHAFGLTEPELAFYEALTSYIQDGYNLAAAKGGKARAIGFVMTVFQKIASSSFAAVKRTLERRLVSLTIHEAVARDAALDVQGRDSLLREAREMLMVQNGLRDDAIGRAEGDRLLADARVRLLKKLRAAEDDGATEAEAAVSEDTASLLVEYALPQERERIRELLALLPPDIESKTRELLDALGQFWAEAPDEKVVIFTTYLGSVDSLRAAIDAAFPGKGIEVLKGGDHGAKLAAERRFRRPDGARVLISTAAGREGINLQFARILVNHDLPWNPMDLEQRIGRIHRYGQNDTVQVYNLVSTSTIEGQVFLLLEQKIEGVARALGKVDERGEVAEDLRSQVLGQLGERLSFNQLYQEALRDPTLQRTSQELEVALHNAEQAREVVSELFQDLEPFKIEDYREVDASEGVKRLKTFLERTARLAGGAPEDQSGTRFVVSLPGQTPVTATTDREEAMSSESLALLGLELPVVAQLLDAHSSLPPGDRALLCASEDGAISTYWDVTVRGRSGQMERRLMNVRRELTGAVSCRVDLAPVRMPAQAAPTAPIDTAASYGVVTSQMAVALRSSLEQIGALAEGATYTARLLAWLQG